ncbi:MAG: hypothetical protein A3F18_04375 [Legionellales bacterium RIFCSPHIGHO2_12_FULL_37_14]|nr:MAG: hypothetical protein A3F18_04375 [Legionellales bacterium RIFCSPHIGHO2_12_FULL_37_14]
MFITVRMLNKYLPFLKRATLFFAYFFIFFAGVSVIFQTLTPVASKYKTQLEEYLTSKLTYSVEIGHIETGWYWFEPILKAKNVVFKNNNNSLLDIKELDLGISLFSSLVHWRFQPGYLFINGVDLTVQKINNNWILQGINVGEGEDRSNFSSYDLLAWVLEHQKLQLKNVNLNLSINVDDKATCQHFLNTANYPGCFLNFTFNNFNATLVNGLGTSRLKGQASLVKPNIAVEFAAEFVSPLLYPNIRGHTYLKFSELKFMPWLNQFIPFDYAISQGKLKGEVWTDISQGKLQAVNTNLDLLDFVFIDNKINKKSNVMQIKGQFGYQRTQQGFALVGEDIKIKDKSLAWPKTSFSVKINPPKDEYHIAVSVLDIEKVLALPIRNKEQLTLLHDLQLRGTLKDLQAKKELNNWTLLTAFQDLSWKAYKDFPSAKNVSGVFTWQKDHARLALDSHNLTLKLPHKKAEVFSSVSSDLYIDKLASGKVYKLNHLDLLHKHLKLNGKGVVTEDAQGAIDKVNFTSNFELFNGTYWLDYLPKGYLKPKLYNFIHDDIHRLDHAAGKIIIDGPWQSFPFDNKNGKFVVATDLSGLDLNYAPNWSEAKDIHGYLEVNARNLTAEISKAKIEKADIQKVSIRVNDLGLDKERLLVHGLAEARAEDAWHIILASPLGKKKSFYRSMHWQNTLKLDLNLDVALYPGNDEVLAKGQVFFANNGLNLNLGFLAIDFNNLSGTLNFDQDGLDTSKLTALLWQKALPIEIVRQQQPFLHTALEINPTLTASDLANMFQQQNFNFLAGEFNTQVKFVFPIVNDKTDSLYITSNLQGLRIDLLPFLQKDVNAAKPFNLKVSFAKDNKTQIAIDYTNEVNLVRASNDVWDINLDVNNLYAHLKFDEKMYLLSGKIDSLSLTKEDFNSSLTGDFTLKPQFLPSMDINIKDLKYAKLDLGSLNIKAQHKDHAFNVTSWELQNLSFAINGKASWKLINDEDESNLSFSVTAKDIHKMLLALQWNPVLEAGKLELSANLNYDYPLWKVKLTNMHGEVDARIVHGRTMNLDKQTESKLGLVKILSLFSLQTIPRRLQLDFSDLSHEGYSFDEFSGEFNLNEGKLQTKTCKFEGPVAATEIFGKVDLDSEIYDLIIRIYPQIAASLPVVATIAGGPVAGAATWLASRLLKNGMQQITSYTYRVTGPWNDPVIEPFKFTKKRQQMLSQLDD